MVYLPEDAEGATQEILIKVITRLSTFEGRSRFSTWLYRLVVNHLLNLKRGRRTPPAGPSAATGESLDATPRDPNTVPADLSLLGSPTTPAT